MTSAKNDAIKPHAAPRGAPPTPALSVIIGMPDNASSVRLVTGSLAAQTAKAGSKC